MKWKDKILLYQLLVKLKEEIVYLKENDLVINLDIAKSLYYSINVYLYNNINI